MNISKVLIETLWNVKRLINAFNDFLVKVLVEKLWNVKIEYTAVSVNDMMY